VGLNIRELIMSKRVLAFGILLAVTVSACTSNVEPGEDVKQSDDDLRSLPGGGIGGGGGGVIDPGPTYCRSVNPSCRLSSYSGRSVVHTDFINAGCGVPQRYVTGNTYDNPRMTVQNCPDTPTVRAIPAKYKNSFYSPVYIGQSVCDNCLPREAGRIYAFSAMGPGPNCGSGCRPPWG
jgi:hypothetical protein